MKLIIEHDAPAGFYLRAYERSKCTHDYLQDTWDAAVSQAEEEFGVPAKKWRQIPA